MGAVLTGTSKSAATSCNSVAQLTRFAVEIVASCYVEDTQLVGLYTGARQGYQLFTNCTKVTGLTLGEEGTVEVPQWGVTGMMSDGQRKLSPISMDFRIENSITASNATAATTVAPGATGPASVAGIQTTNNTALLFNMFENRGNAKYDINVYITNRAFQTLFVYSFTNCDMRSIKTEDQELGSPKLGTITAEFLPLDVVLKTCDNTKTFVNSRQRLSATATSC